MNADHWFPADKAFIQALLAARMPFGKFKDQSLLALSPEYRQWLELSQIAKGPLQTYLNVINELERQNRQDILNALRKAAGL